MRFDALSHTSKVDNFLDGRTSPFWNLPYKALVYGLQTHPVNRLRRK